MTGSQKLLGTLIAATLVAGVVGLLTQDTMPDGVAAPSPTTTLAESPTESPTPTPTETVAESPSPSPTVAETPTPMETEEPEPEPTEKPRTAESGIGTSYALGIALLFVAGGVWRFRRQAY